MINELRAMSYEIRAMSYKIRDTGTGTILKIAPAPADDNGMSPGPYQSALYIRLGQDLPTSAA